MISRRVTVEWIGGPFDRQKFKVPEGQHAIRFGTTTLVVDLDMGGRMSSLDRQEIDLPIVRRGRRHYVVWKE